MGTTKIRQQPAYYDVVDRDDLYETRIPSSVRRYRPMYKPQTTLLVCVTAQTRLFSVVLALLTGLPAVLQPQRYSHIER